MKKIYFIVILALCSVVFSSCDKKQGAVSDLESFTEELEENSAEYTSDEWQEADSQFEAINQELDQYEYTDDELQEIGRLKARCVKQMTKGAMQQFKDNVNSIEQQLKGALEELNTDDSEGDNN